MKKRNICLVHDADDVIPTRTCGRYKPCRIHEPENYRPKMINKASKKKSKKDT